jgi:small conductance mechanosensitive channel
MLLQTIPIVANPLPSDSVKQVTRDLVYQIQSDPETFVNGLLHRMLDFGLRVLVALILYIIGIWLIGWVKRGLKNYFDRRKTEPTLASFVSSFVSISLTVLLIVISISTVGVNTTSLAALLAAGGMAIGMALSGTVQNFAGGIMLLAFKPFKAGDFIEAQGFSGKVIEVNITATKILTVDNRVVILPNGALSNGTINNVTGRPLRRVEWLVSVAYGSDADQFEKTVLAMLAEDERVLQSDTDMDKLYKEVNMSAYQLTAVNYQIKEIPAPYVALKSLNESDITFLIRVWTKSDNYWNLFFDMQKRFYTELPQHGFSFAYPHVVVEHQAEA